MDASITKKKLEKNKHARSEALNAPLVDANALVSKHKHSKKRKRDPQFEHATPESPAVVHPIETAEEPDASEGKKKRKKKEKKDDDFVHSAPAAQCVDSAGTAPRSKKKKERKMSEREHSDAVGTATEVSSVCLICLRYPDKIIIFCPAGCPHSKYASFDPAGRLLVSRF